MAILGILGKSRGAATGASKKEMALDEKGIAALVKSRQVIKFSIQPNLIKGYQPTSKAAYEAFLKNNDWALVNPAGKTLVFVKKQDLKPEFYQVDKNSSEFAGKQLKLKKGIAYPTEKQIDYYGRDRETGTLRRIVQGEFNKLCNTQRSPITRHIILELMKNGTIQQLNSQGWSKGFLPGTKIPVFKPSAFPGSSNSQAQNTITLANQKLYPRVLVEVKPDPKDRTKTIQMNRSFIVSDEDWENYIPPKGWYKEQC